MGSTTLRTRNVLGTVMLATGADFEDRKKSDGGQQGSGILNPLVILPELALLCCKYIVCFVSDIVA